MEENSKEKSKERMIDEKEFNLPINANQAPTGKKFECPCEVVKFEKDNEIITKYIEKKKSQSDSAIQKLILVSIICTIFMTIELTGGIISGSIAILSDAAHMLSDFAGFAISMVAIKMGNLKASDHMSFGYHRAEIVGALCSVMMIWVLTALLLNEAKNRLVDENYEINSDWMIGIATFGLICNLIMGKVLHSSGHHSHSHSDSDHHHHHHEDENEAKLEFVDYELEHSHHSLNNTHDYELRKTILEIQINKNDNNNAELKPFGQSIIKNSDKNHEKNDKSNETASKEHRSKDIKTTDTHVHEAHSHDHHEHTNDNQCHQAHSHENHSHKEHSHKEHAHDNHQHSHDDHSFKSFEVNKADNNNKKEIPRENLKSFDIQSLSSHGSHGVNKEHKHKHHDQHKEAHNHHKHDHGHHHHKDHHSHDEHNHNHCHGHKHDHEENINVRAAMIHVIGDLIQSVGVLIAAIIIKLKPNLEIIDPICTVVFSVIVIFTTIPIVRDCLKVIMEGTPNGINVKEVERDLLSIDGVEECHDLHVWALSIGKSAMSAHIISSTPMKSLRKATRMLNTKYKILHTTIQIEDCHSKFKCQSDLH